MEQMEQTNQLQLFPIHDDRLIRLREALRCNMPSVMSWIPNVKGIEQMEKDWKISGRIILDIYKEVKDRQIKDIESEIDGYLDE